MKKVIKAIFAIIGSILGLIVLLVGFLAGSLYTKDTTEIDRGSFDPSTFATSMISKSLDHTREDRALSVSIEQEALNGLLGELVNGVDEKASEFADSYIRMDETGYELVIRGHYKNYYYTRAALKMSLLTVKGATPMDDYFKFRIVDLEVGHFDGLLNLAKDGLKIANSYFDVGFDVSEYVQGFLDNANISATFSYDDLSIIYKMTDFIGDIKDMVTSGSSDETISLYMSFLDEFINYDMINFDFQRADHKASIIVDLDLVAKGINPYKDLKLTDAIDTNVKAAIQTLYSNGACTFEDVPNLYKYFFEGYESISSDNEIKSLVDNLDVSSLGADFDKTNYVGILPDSSVDPVSIILNQVSSFGPFDIGKILSGKTLAYVKETELDSYVQSMDGVLGFNFLLPREENGQLIINDIVVNNIYTDIRDNQMDLFVGLSFNGCDTCISVSTELVTGDNPYLIQFKIKSIKLGHLDVTDGLGTSLLLIIKAAMGSDGMIRLVLPESMKGDQPDEARREDLETDHGSFVMDFSSALDDNMTSILESNNRTIGVRLSDQPSGNGRLELYTRPITSY